MEDENEDSVNFFYDAIAAASARVVAPAASHVAAYAPAHAFALASFPRIIMLLEQRL